MNAQLCTQKLNPSTICLNYDYTAGSLKDSIFLLGKFEFKKLTYEKQNSYQTTKFLLSQTSFYIISISLRIPSSELIVI